MCYGRQTMKISTRNLFKRLLGRTDFPMVRPLIFISPGIKPSAQVLQEGFQCVGCGHIYRIDALLVVDVCLNCAVDIVEKVALHK